MADVFKLAAELRRLLEQATPAPWFVGEWPGEPRGDVHVLWGDEGDGHATFLLAKVEGALRDEECRADVDLIAAMRNALPALLDAIDELREANKRLAADRIRLLARRKDDHG